MATVVADTLPGQGVTLDSDGYRHRRPFRVYGLTGDPDEIEYQALQEAGIPAKGAAHPTIPGIVVLSLNSRLIEGSLTECQVIADYGPLPGGELADEITASAGTILYKDLDAEQEPLKRSKDRTGTNITDSGGTVRSVLLDVANLILRVDRVAATLDDATLVTYLGHVNSAIWNGYAARTWFCSHARSVPIRGRADGAHRESFVFKYRATTWDPLDQFYWSAALVQVNRPEVQPEVDFAALGITF